ncbi:MAG: hypothetical protein M3Q61_06770, partial [Chloroflexota bacterium]|nr:hypothetical protein [Chloroflexota bacterium]
MRRPARIGRELAERLGGEEQRQAPGQLQHLRVRRPQRLDLPELRSRLLGPAQRAVREAAVREHQRGHPAELRPGGIRNEPGGLRRPAFECVPVAADHLGEGGQQRGVGAEVRSHRAGERPRTARDLFQRGEVPAHERDRRARAQQLELVALGVDDPQRRDPLEQSLGRCRVAAIRGMVKEVPQHLPLRHVVAARLGLDQCLLEHRDLVQRRRLLIPTERAVRERDGDEPAVAARPRGGLTLVDELSDLGGVGVAVEGTPARADLQRRGVEIRGHGAGHPVGGTRLAV